MSQCEYFEQLCAVSIDGTLTDDERNALDAHLAECPSCAALYSDLQQMNELLQAEVQVPDSLHEAIMDRVCEEAKTKVVQPEKPARRMPVFTMVAAAAVVVLVAMGGGIGQFFSMVGGGSSGSADNNSMASVSNRDSAFQKDAATADAGAATGAAAAEVADAAASVELPEPVPDVPALEPDPDTYYQPSSAVPAGNASEPESAPASEPESKQEQKEQDDANSAVFSSGTVEGQEMDSGGYSAKPTEGIQDEIQARDMDLIILPDSILGRTVAHCYLAAGAGELPSVEGDLLVADGNISYFSLQNNMSLIEKTLRDVEAAGFEVSTYEDVGLVNDPKADTWLLIVRTEE